MRSGLTRYAICKATGIDKASMSRFVRGERGLSYENLDRLADYLGLEVVCRKRATRQARKRAARKRRG